MIEDLGRQGEVFSYKDFLVYFSKKPADLKWIKAVCKNNPVCELKQTHSDIIHEGDSKNILEGDAQWTNKKNELLVIKTADCLPVMIASPKNHIAAAVHAGWRGVEKHIIEKTLILCRLQEDPDLRIWIGPHIQMSDFEVDADVADKILKAYKLSLDTADPTVMIKKGNKYHLNLALLVGQSLVKMGIREEQIEISKKNTRQSAEHFSYRRGERGVSNYSFIVQI